jgi:hypothetical protein
MNNKNIRSKTVDKKTAYFVAMLCLTLFGNPAIFLIQNAIEVLSPSIGNAYEVNVFGGISIFFKSRQLFLHQYLRHAGDEKEPSKPYLPDGDLCSPLYFNLDSGTNILVFWWSISRFLTKCKRKMGMTIFN